jgi:hypothetical protein
LLHWRIFKRKSRLSLRANVTNLYQLWPPFVASAAEMTPIALVLRAFFLCFQ